MLDRNFDALAFLGQQSVIGAGAIAPGLAVGRLQGELRIAGEKAIQDLQRTQLQTTAAALIGLQGQRQGASLQAQAGLDREIERFVRERERASVALAAQTEAIRKTTSPFAALRRGAVGVAGAFGVLELASLGLSALFNKLTAVTPEDLAQDARGIAKSLQDAIGEGAGKVTQDALRAQLQTRIDSVDRLSTKALQDSADAARAGRETLAEIARPGRRAERSDPSQTRVSREAIANFQAQTAAAEQLGKEMQDLAKTANLAEKATKQLVDVEQRRRAALQAALPFLTQHRQDSERLRQAQETLGQAVTLGAIGQREYKDALDRLNRSFREETIVLDLNTDTLRETFTPGKNWRPSLTASRPPLTGL